MRNNTIRETGLLGDAMCAIRALLPASWSVKSAESELGDGSRADAVVSLSGPAGQKVAFLAEVKPSVRSAGATLAVLREIARRSRLPLLFVSDYIGPTLREALTDENISYADGTGWVRLASDSPLILLTGQGASRSPQAGAPASIARLNGVAAGRVVRALCESSAPFGVREAARGAGVSPGSVSKLLPTLAAEGIIDRDDHGAVIAIRRRALIRRWIQDYSFTGTNRSVGSYIAVRGIDRTLARLADAGEPFTVSGSVAARQLLADGVTSIVPLRTLSFYSAAGASEFSGLGLIPAEASEANVFVATPQDERILSADVAPVALVLADLLTLPGRGDAEAEQLMDHLAQSDPAWRN